MSKPQTNDAPPNESKFKRHGGEETEECAWRIGRCCSTNAAGIDVGAREMFVAVPPGRDNIPVRVFASFTRRSPALGRLAGALPRDHGGLGAHWGLLDSLYELSEQRGIHPCLVNARHMKNVPGRRTDWHECQWLQFLSCGIHPSKPPTRSSAAADEIIRKSLVGNWRSEHLFTLRQSLEFYRFYQQQIVAVIWKSRRCR
jgi:hypothetical protein